MRTLVMNVRPAVVPPPKARSSADMAMPLPGAPPIWVAYNRSGVAVIANVRLPMETRFMVVTIAALGPSNSSFGWSDAVSGSPVES